MMRRQFGTPPVVLNLIIINALLWLASALLPAQVGNFIYNNLALFPADSSYFHTWQLVTYMFLHNPISIWHLAFNMFTLWMFGRTLEYELGSRRFLIYYMVCGVGAGLIQLLVNWLLPPGVLTVGASGAIFGLLLAFGMMHPNDVIMLLFPPVAMKAKWFVIIFGIISLLLGLGGWVKSIAHFAHLGGMLWGFMLLWLWKKQRKIRY